MLWDRYFSTAFCHDNSQAITSDGETFPFSIGGPKRQGSHVVEKCQLQNELNGVVGSI